MQWQVKQKEYIDEKRITNFKQAEKTLIHEVMTWWSIRETLITLYNMWTILVKKLDESIAYAKKQLREVKRRVKIVSNDMSLGGW